MNNNGIFKEQLNELIELKEIVDKLHLYKYIQPIDDFYLSKSNLKNNENYINNIVNEIRVALQKDAFYKIVDIYKSPLYIVNSESINSTNYTYDYERTIKYEYLEETYNMDDFFDGFTLLYSSGMSTLSSILSLILKFKDKVKCFSHIGYFENKLLIEDLKNVISEVDIFDKQLLCIENDFDLLFIECVRSNFELDYIDIMKVLSSIDNNSEKIKFIVFDISFLGNTFVPNDILKLFYEHKRIIFIFYRSGIKLDQMGFEVLNLGILSLYFTKDLFFIKEKLLSFMKDNRSRNGHCLSVMDIHLLEDIQKINNKNYANVILDNTEYFVSKLKYSNNSFMDRIIYPDSVYENFKLYKTPYFFIKLKNASEEDYINLCKYIKYRFLTDGVDISFRTSFGFRNVSFEYVKIRNLKNSEVLKIAPGYMRGYSFYKFIDILNEIFNKTYKEFLTECENMLNKKF